MNLSLPFYEKKGTISRIEEQDKNYKVYRYGINKKEITIFMVPKNNKNYNLLRENYYNDLKDYLVKYANKYESYKITRLKKKIDMNLVSILTSISIIMLVSSIPLLLTYESLGYIGVLLEILSIPILITTTDLRLKNSNDKKKAEFIKKYNQLEEQLRIYNKDKTKKNNKTTFKGIKNSNTKDPVIDLVLTKEKKKVA